MMRKQFAVLIALLLVFSMTSFASCTEVPLSVDTYVKVDYEPTHTSETRLITYKSSDDGLDNFLNEYRERHMRYSENQIHSHPVGAGSTAWKEWEAMIGSWWDASAENGTLPVSYATKDLVTEWLLNPKQDNQGYIWTDEGDSLSSWSMGWQFPNAVETGGTVFDFSEGDNGFSVLGDGVTGGIVESAYQLVFRDVSKAELISPEFEQSALIAPFLQMNFSMVLRSGDLEDIYIYYRTESSPNWSEDKKVSFSDGCTTGFSIEDVVDSEGYFFPMYLQEAWGENRTTRITQIKIVFQAKQNKTFSGSASFSYIATDYDDRLALNVCNYILAAKSVLEYSQDESLLEYLLPYARKAMNFLFYQLNGESGLVSTEYFVGHDNTGLHQSGTGLGDGYWDVLAFPDVNIYVNLSYYHAICAMEYLENMAENRGIETETVTTVNAQMSGIDEYTLTADDLSDLKESCISEFRTEFWNDKTGRFHAGKIGGTTVQDHGYLMFNEQAVALGLATETQAESILQWINGERIVTGDDSTGDDIYYYEFAPRFNTAEIGSDFYWGYSSTFGGNVQNGGTALHLAYYDIVAQASINVDTAYSRLKTIQSWYEKVRAAGGEGWNFYRAYYNSTMITLQGGDSSGEIGLDYEFLEAALLLCVVPDAFFGISGTYDNTLVVEPSIPSELDWWTMENITYGGKYLDITISQYFVQISSVEEMSAGNTVSNAQVKLVLDEPTFDYRVFVNGQEITDYSSENGKIYYTCALQNVRLEIVEK